MNTAQIADIVGYIGAFLGIIMFLPQVIQVFKTKDTKSISLPTFILLNLNSFTWVVYGLLIKSNPVILVNFVILVLGLYITTMKLKHG